MCVCACVNMISIVAKRDTLPLITASTLNPTLKYFLWVAVDGDTTDGIELQFLDCDFCAWLPLKVQVFALPVLQWHN